MFKWDEVEEELEDYYEDDDFEAVSYVYEYDDNGVLVYYERAYDGDPMVIVQTLQREISGFLGENILWIVLGIIGTVAVIVVVVIVIYKRRK